MYMFTFSSGTCHDGSVADWGDVVAANGSGHAGRDGDDAQGVGVGEHGDADGYQDAEGSPAGACGEGEQGCHHEDDGGQQLL